MNTLFDPVQRDILVHLLAALVAGGVIGLERSFQARPAGFRTHSLVCLASSLLMLLTLYQNVWLPGTTGENFRADPARMAQGIMTGIGFLGAGVIFKEGPSTASMLSRCSTKCNPYPRPHGPCFVFFHSCSHGLNKLGTC